MSGSPELVLKRSDGSLLTRVEAEKELWDKCKTSHAMRRVAWSQFGLENRFAWMLKPTSIVHWVLDEMIRKRMIAGDQIGVQPELESDESYFNSYIQRLRVFVEDGRALKPKEGEGIDMSDFQNQMPPQNGQPVPQQSFSPPPPPVGFPGQQPPQQAPQSFAPPPPPQQYGAPPQAMPGYQAPPQMPQFGAPPSFPPQGAQPPVSQPQLPPQGAPPAPPAQAPSNRRRAKADAGAPPPGMPQVPSQQSMPFAGPSSPPLPGTFAQPSAPPQFGTPQVAQADSSALQAQINELKGQVDAQGKVLQQLLHILKGVDAAASIMLRPYYKQQMPQQASQLSTEATFNEIGMPYPS